MEILKRFTKNRAVIKEVYPDGSIGYACATYIVQKTTTGEKRYWSTCLPDCLYPKKMQSLITKLMKG